MSTLINLIDDQSPPPSVEIIQLYEELELLRLDTPPRHTLFILGREADAPGDDRLLLIDPPPDLPARFRLDGHIAILNTLASHEHNADFAPRLASQSGGTAHIRLGRHFLDIYTQGDYSVVLFPTLGVLYSGGFGSDVDLPRLAHGDDGLGALETVRILAAIVKARPIQLQIPALGALSRETIPTMEQLAADVAYLHNLRRLAPALQTAHQAHADGAKVAEIAATLLPTSRRSTTARATHAHNMKVLTQITHRLDG